jgi:hypothetical protein
LGRAAVLISINAGRAVLADGYLKTHCINPKLLRDDAFETFMNDREQRLLGLIAKATGHDIVAAAGPPDEQEVPDDIAEDSGLLANAAA